MILEINGKNYELKFGFDFLEYLNKHNSLTMEMNGQVMNSGMGGATLLASTLQTKMPSTLFKTIKAATSHLPQKPSDADIEAYINKLAEDDDEYNLVFEEIEEGLKSNPLSGEKWGFPSRKQRTSRRKTNKLHHRRVPSHSDRAVWLIVRANKNTDFIRICTLFTGSPSQAAR